MIHHQFCSTKSKTLTRLLTILSLAVCSLTAGIAEADLISITSGSTELEIWTGTTGSGGGNNDITDGIHGPVTLSGYSGQIERIGYESGVKAEQTTDLNMPFPRHVDSFLKGTSIVNFTALNNLDYVTFGAWGFVEDGDGNLDNREWNWSIFDHTSGTYLENYSRTRQNGVDNGGSNTGTQTGKMLIGRNYTFSSEFIVRENPDLDWDVPLNRSQTSGFLTFATAVPEPSSAAILAFAGLGMFMRRRRR